MSKYDIPDIKNTSFEKHKQNEIYLNILFLGFCAVYNTIEMKVIDDFNVDCTNFTKGKCPTRYISTDAYKCKLLIFTH